VNIQAFFVLKVASILHSNNFAISGICHFWQLWWTLFAKNGNFVDPKIAKIGF